MSISHESITNYKIYYLTQAQYDALVLNGSITVDGQTIQYDPTAEYRTPAGDELNNLKSAINGLNSTDNLFDKNAPGIDTGKYIRSDGKKSNSGIGSVSDYIPVIPNTTLMIYPVVTQAAWYCTYHSGNNLKSVREIVPLANVSSLSIPDDTYFIRITFLTASLNDIVIKYKNTDILAITNAAQISSLNNDLKKHYAKIENIDLWAQGTIDASDGSAISSLYRITSGSLYAFDGIIAPENGYSIAAAVYDKDSTYLGIYNGEEIVKSIVFFETFIPIYDLPESYQIRIILRKNDLSSITPSSAGDKAFIIKYQLNTSLRFPIKQKNQYINGKTHCAFPSMCNFAGKKIIAYRYSKSHLVPSNTDEWGGIQIDSVANGLVVKHEISLDNNMFTGLDGEIRDPHLGVSNDGNYMILAAWTTYYVDGNRKFDNLLVCFDYNLNILNYQIIKPSEGVQPFKFWGSPLFTPTGHLLVTGYNYTSDTSSADNSVILWRSEEVFSGDVSTLTMYNSATVTEFDDSGEASIGYIDNKLVAIFRRQSHNSFIKISDDVEGTTAFPDSINYDVGYAIHAPKLLPHTTNNNLFFVGTRRLSSSKRETVLGYFDIASKTVKEVRGIDDINYNYGGYAGFVADGQDRFCVVYYIEDTSTSLSTGYTGLFLRYVNAREILSTLN